MQRIDCMLKAALIAANVCDEWKIAETDAFIPLAAMFQAAAMADEEHPIDDDMYYVVSSEGAIGLAYKREYLTQWLYLPAEDFPEERKAFYEKAKQEAEKQKQQTPQQTQSPPQQAAQPQQKQPQPNKPKFCKNCGSPLAPGANNCPKCGIKIE